MPTTKPAITFVALSLNNTERSNFVRASREVLPELELFLAVNGYSKEETIRRLGTTPLKFHPYTFCNSARFATFGSLANYVSKYLALRMQVRRRLPYMAMLEDDMLLRPGFRAFVEQAVRGGALEGAELLVLGAWGEGYVTSLASARLVLASLGRQGVPLTIDIMLNDGHAGRAVRIGALRGDSVPWAHRVPPNGGDCLRTAHIGRQDLPRRLQHTCSGGPSCMRHLYCMRHIYCRMRLHCLAGAGAPPSEAEGAKLLRTRSSRRSGGQAPNRSSLTPGTRKATQKRWLDEMRRSRAAG